METFATLTSKIEDFEIGRKIQSCHTRTFATCWAGNRTTWNQNGK